MKIASAAIKRKVVKEEMWGRLQAGDLSKRIWVSVDANSIMHKKGDYDKKVEASKGIETWQ